MAIQTIPAEAELAKLYRFRDEAKVLGFLETNPNVAALLMVVAPEIQRYFGAHALGVDLVLEEDPENPLRPEMFAVIQCDLDADAALDLLDEWQRKWWSHVSFAAKAPLHVDIEYAKSI
jgi:hypothetical protein